MLSKTLVIGIIFLFIIVYIIPSICGNFTEIKDHMQHLIDEKNDIFIIMITTVKKSSLILLLLDILIIYISVVFIFYYKSYISLFLNQIFYFYNIL